MTTGTQRELVTRLSEKILRNRAELEDVVEDGVDGADVVVVSYGISARIAARAVDLARARGLSVGLLRLRTVWPFPDERIRSLSTRITGFVVPEINLGQIVREVERCAADGCGVLSVPHPGGDIHEVEDVLEAIVRAAERKAPTRAELAGAGR